MAISEPEFETAAPYHNKKARAGRLCTRQKRVCGRHEGERARDVRILKLLQLKFDST
jgi:hypothetical protein